MSREEVTSGFCRRDEDPVTDGRKGEGSPWLCDWLYSARNANVRGRQGGPTPLWACFLLTIAGDTAQNTPPTPCRMHQHCDVYMHMSLAEILYPSHTPHAPMHTQTNPVEHRRQTSKNTKNNKKLKKQEKFKKYLKT